MTLISCGRFIVCGTGPNLFFLSTALSCFFSILWYFFCNWDVKNVCSVEHKQPFSKHQRGSIAFEYLRNAVSQKDPFLSEEINRERDNDITPTTKHEDRISRRELFVMAWVRHLPFKEMQCWQKMISALFSFFAILVFFTVKIHRRDYWHVKTHAWKLFYFIWPGLKRRFEFNSVVIRLE